jgi:hypothetical protein
MKCSAMQQPLKAGRQSQELCKPACLTHHACHAQRPQQVVEGGTPLRGPVKHDDLQVIDGTGLGRSALLVTTSHNLHNIRHVTHSRVPS